MVKSTSNLNQKETSSKCDVVAKKEKIECWDNLKGIINKVPQKKKDIEIGLLIGANCARALEPQEMIPSKNGRLFAFRPQ